MMQVESIYQHGPAFMSGMMAREVGEARQAPAALDEAALIVAAQRGSLAAFNQLVVKYQGLAYNVAYRLLGDPEAAADATQDSFLKAYRALGQFRGDSIKGWVIRIVTNTCYDQLRRWQRRPADSLDDLPADSDRADSLIDWREGPEALALREELRHVIHSCIGRLPADQRIALVLVDIQGFNYQQVADLTGATLGTVKSRLSRGRARLRDVLLRHGDLFSRN